MVSSTIRAMRLILYTLGFVSMFLVIFMAQRLEQKFQSLEARLLEVSFKPEKDGDDSSRKGFIESSLIYQKARQFREYASNAESILESMDSARRDEDAFTMSGVLGNKNLFNVLGGLGLRNSTMIANMAAQTSDSEGNRRSREEYIKQMEDLLEMEKKIARHESNVNKADSSETIRQVVLSRDEDKAAEEEERINRLENEDFTYHKKGDTSHHLLSEDHALKLTNKDGSLAKDNVLVVIISNRRDGILPTVASILTTSTRPVDLVLVGEHEINEDARKHFGDRINEFTSMSVKDIEDDLVAQGHNPIWTWKEWHTSMDPSWKNENTLHVGVWDNLMTHAHVLNHIRFYLPLCSIFKGRPYFYFLDDDILVQHDLGALAVKTMNDLPPERGLVCPCNIWMWNSECFDFEFQSKKDFIMSMPSLYGDRGVCKTESEAHCVPENYWDWVRSVMPKGGELQHAWNFGFSLFNIENWVNNKLTAKYEFVMRQSYERHVFPETSLTFGLGVAYIAFAGAVECWNEDYVRVRDGFGFIEWDRYAKTFGDDFFKSVDVVHYTGPDKPWVDESRIEQRAIVPWLKMMEQEKMPIPTQLPLEPTSNLFTVLGGDRAGVHWIMSVLDSHPHVCASGEADKPETGFSADVLHPSGIPWYPYCSIKRGCSLEFYKKHIHELINEPIVGGKPKRCSDGYDVSKDEITGHLKRLCNVIDRLSGNYTDGAIAKVWVDGFVEEDRTITGCGCVRGVRAKGLKVLAEWITYRGYPGEMVEPPQIDLNNTRVVGSKIIRVKRRNTWARYKSMMIAIATDRYHPSNIGEKRDQLHLLPNLTIDVHHMEWNMRNFMAVDRAGDEWAMKHGSEILWLDYENCRLDTATCFQQIYKFIGVDQSHVTGKHKATYESSFAEMEDHDSSLDNILNRGEIKEVLGGNGWGHMIGGEKYTPIQFMQYHTEPSFVRTFNAPGTNTVLFGNDPHAEGYGNKFKSAVPFLRQLDPEALVVLCDDRDCWTNFPVNDRTYDSLFMFRENFDKLTQGYPGAVVVSAEMECCAAALTHIKPGDLFDEDGKRRKRSCLSGESGCNWDSSINAEKWREFMTGISTQRAQTKLGKKRAFVDGTILVGKAGDFLKFIEQTDISSNEDDRAVLADYLHRFPSKLIVDHEQVVVGETREVDGERNPNCPKWHKDNNSRNIEEARSIDFLSSTPPDKRPLFLFTPRFHGCDYIKKPLPAVYPVWGSNGIALQPLIDHIKRVENVEESIVLLPMYGRVPDYRQGPEIPYFVDSKGIWTSNTIRANTDETTFDWRLRFAENNKMLAMQILYDEAKANPTNVRWSALWKNIQGGVGFLYWAWYGDYKACNKNNYDKDSIPLLTTCANRFCDHSFPIPNYMNIIDSQATSQNWRGVFREREENYPWEGKVDKIVWRGALSEAEWRDALTSVRWRVNKMVTDHNLQGSTLYDVGLTGIPRWLTTRVQFNISEVGGFLPVIEPMTTFMKYKAILDMDGNSWSSRFGTLLCYNSVVVKVEPKYFEYFYPELKAWKHYIPVKNDLTDFDKNIRWALNPANDKAVRDIVESANDWCSHRFLPDELARDQLDVWESYVREMNRGSTDWERQLAAAKNTVFARASFNVTNIAPGLELKV